MKSLLLAGLAVLSRHTKLWFVIALLVVLPAVLLLSFTSLHRSTEANIKSVLIQRMSSFQDVLSYVVEQGSVRTDELDEFTIVQSDLVRLVVLQEQSQVFTTIYNTDKSKIGVRETQLEGFRAAILKPGETVIFETHNSGARSWQAYRYLPSSNLYLLSEHQFLSLEALIIERWTRAYLVLSLVFLFLIALAYWVMRQINFEQRYFKISEKMKQRDLITEGMVHELRAPLTAMRGYASLIEESNIVPETEREYARRISESSARLVELVSDFLRAAKVHANEVVVDSQAVNIEQLLDRVSSQFKAEAKAKGLLLAIATIPLTESLFTDEKRLEQILTNLVSNAIKYTKTGTINLSVEQNFRNTTFTVADTGSGMSAEDQKKLFAPFVRVGDVNTQAKVTGTGLGMWLTKEMVEQLKGSIGVESIKGMGTHVVVTLPNRTTLETLVNKAR